MEAAAVAAEFFLCCFPLVCFSISISIPAADVATFHAAIREPERTDCFTDVALPCSGGRFGSLYLLFLVYHQLSVDCHETTQQTGLNKAAEIVVRQTPPTVD